VHLIDRSEGMGGESIGEANQGGPGGYYVAGGFDVPNRLGLDHLTLDHGVLGKSMSLSSHRRPEVATPGFVWHSPASHNPILARSLSKDRAGQLLIRQAGSYAAQCVGHVGKQVSLLEGDVHAVLRPAAGNGDNLSAKSVTRIERPSASAVEPYRYGNFTRLSRCQAQRAGAFVSDMEPGLRDVDSGDLNRPGAGVADSNVVVDRSAKRSGRCGQDVDRPDQGDLVPKASLNQPGATKAGTEQRRRDDDEQQS
jgi:hypothetical protein